MINESYGPKTSTRKLERKPKAPDYAEIALRIYMWALVIVGLTFLCTKTARDLW